jgi:hypothetical protein
MGKALVSVGLAALLADIAFLAPPFGQLIESGRRGLLGLVPTLGLSLLHVARAIVLEQADYFSLASRILVLFSALVLMVIGAQLWSSRSPEAAAQNRQRYAGSDEGDR